MRLCKKQDPTTTLFEIEKSLSRKELNEFLILRRYEKNIMLYKDQTVYEAFKSLKPLNLEGNKEIEKYRILVHKLSENYKIDITTVRLSILRNEITY